MMWPLLTERNNEPRVIAAAAAAFVYDMHERGMMQAGSSRPFIHIIRGQIDHMVGQESDNLHRCELSPDF